jgi:arylsulfatase A-like enzyme
MLLPILLVFGVAIPAAAADRPNILLVITDDQGFGDLGAHGNPILKTPNLDAFAKQSTWLKNFYVCPVCSPTRSSLMTGLYNYRTGVVDTFIGRSMMRPDVTTLPQLLAASGYRTGLFGKWHLGDNYPMRPEDRGFQETLWLQGGGLAQPGDPPSLDPATAYFNPILKKNGKEVKTRGYCTDVITDGAVGFIKSGSDKPFFAYVAYNAPHGPYQVPEENHAKYAKLDLSPDAFPKIGQPWAAKKLNEDQIARAYGMIENIDANFARMLKTIDDAKATENTIVIFMTDNGPGGVRWNAGLRARKGTPYEGGIRVPFYVRWPAKTDAGNVIDTPLAHIDVAPTLLEAAGVKVPDGLDGRSFLGLLRGEEKRWPDRILFTQWHRGDVPEKFRAFAARGPRYKLGQAAGVPQDAKWKPKFEIFDIPNDPFEQHDLAAEKPEEVAKLKKAYDEWFASVTKKGFEPPRIIVGSGKENPVRLSRQDWRGPKAGWGADSIGHWEIKIERAGKYRVTVRSKRPFESFRCEVRTVFLGVQSESPVTSTDTTMEFPAGAARVEAIVKAKQGTWGPDYVEFEYLGPPGKE